MKDGKWLSTQEAADKLGVSRKTIYNLIDKKLLIAVKLGPNCLRIEPAELERYIRDNSTADAVWVWSRRGPAPTE